MPQKILLYGFTIRKTARSYPHALEKNHKYLTAWGWLLRCLSVVWEKGAVSCPSMPRRSPGMERGHLEE